MIVYNNATTWDEDAEETETTRQDEMRTARTVLVGRGEWGIGGRVGAQGGVVQGGDENQYEPYTGG